jgi:hypothetical protein
VAVISLLLQLWAWIVKILLQEVVGHQVWWYDAGASTDTFYNRLVLDAPDRRSDIEIQSYLQPAAPTEDYRTNHMDARGGGTTRRKQKRRELSVSFLLPCELCCLFSLFFQVLT